MLDSAELTTLVNYCETRLPLEEVCNRADTFGYTHLPLCIVDAVYSIGVNYASTWRVVERTATFFDVEPSNRRVAQAQQLAVSRFIEAYETHGVDGMLDSVFQNRQRTSVRNGILKAEAVLHFAHAVAKHGGDYIEDVDILLSDDRFAEAVKQIPGQRSGISLRYFFMLAGNDDYVKPDRMIERFILAGIGRKLTPPQMHDAIVRACSQLKQRHPALTPRLLDNAIWAFQRQR